jgi:uncharacterized protein with HEPN domain/predicted nucleotidyltransferase
MPAQIDIDRDAVAEFCQRHHIQKLALFGSVLRADFRADSDVDVLVAFDPEHRPGDRGLSAIESELTPLLGGHRPDLSTFDRLNRHIRGRVLAVAEPLYGELERPMTRDQGDRPPKDDTLYLHHMRDNAAEAMDIAAGKTRQAFDADRILRLALTRVVQNIGEAATQVYAPTRDAHPEIDWKDIIGTRHRLVHGYVHVDDDVLWGVVTRDLEPLIAKLDPILQSCERDPDPA